MSPTTRLVNAARRGLGTPATTPLRVLAATAASIQQWAHGAEGRRRTRVALRPLERSGWLIDHDIALPGGVSVDHLAVGPSGVYVLDSRAWPGVVTVDHKGATVTPQDHPGAAWTAYGHHRALPPAAAAIFHSLAAAAGAAIPAPRVAVAVWSPFPECVAVSGGVTYVAGEHLTDWLSSQPCRLDDAQVTALARADLAAAVPAQRSSGTASRRVPLD